MSINLTGADKLQARFRAIGHTEAVVRDIIIHGVADAKHLVPHKTRNLSRTIRPGRITPLTGELLAGGRLKVGYAGAVERGTRPHVIRPKNKKSLFFPSQKVTTARFGPGARLKFNLSGSLSAGSMRQFGNAAYAHATVVHHPGTRAQPYLVPGLRKAARERGVAAVVELWNAAA